MTPAASPRGRSSAAGYLSIGQVLARLTPEFPSLTSSKLRFLEVQGIVTPMRTESGYRKFSSADVARVRTALTLQRDHYLPLARIREYLDEHGADGASAAAVPTSIVQTEAAPEMRGRVLALALGLVLSDWLRGWIFTGFPWALTGHVWIATPAAQISAWGGALILSALTLSAAALPGWCWRPAAGLRGFRRGAVLAAMLIVAAAMAARQLSARAASAGALSISMVIAALIVWYFRLYVHAPIAIGYGMYVAAAMTVLAVVLSVLTMVVAWGQARL